MKLLYCKKCQDAFNLSHKRVKKCGCGAVEGKYLEDKLNAEYSGPAIPFAIDNFSFAARALGKKDSTHNKIYDKMHGEDNIQAWIMREENPNYKTIKKVRRKKQLGVCGR